MEILVSIIVPVYNAEKTIERCLQSLLEQNLSRLEVIAVNDGSTDATGELLRQLQGQYPSRLVVLDQQNTGVWQARKNGIEHARGKYIGFCDSDDYVLPEMYEKMLHSMQSNHSQIAVCAYQRYRGEQAYGGVEMTGFGDSVYELREDNLGELSVINTALWNKLFAASVLRKGIDFDNPPHIAEDMMLFLSVLPYVERISFLKEPLYCYMIYEDSAMHSMKEEDARRTMAAMLEAGRLMPDKYADLTAIMAFIHIGISLPVGLANSGFFRSKGNYRLFEEYLDRYFPRWKRNRYLNMKYMSRHGWKLWKPWVVQRVYRLHMFPAFVKMYSILTSALKINIKW